MLTKCKAIDECSFGLVWQTKPDIFESLMLVGHEIALSHQCKGGVELLPMTRLLTRLQNVAGGNKALMGDAMNWEIEARKAFEWLR